MSKLDNSPFPDTAPKVSSPLRRLAITGALWLTAISAAAVPLGYLRTWLLGNLSEAGAALGVFAGLMIFAQIVFTFAVPGGSSVLTSLLPKAENANQKARLVQSYFCLTLTMALAFSIFIACFPRLFTQVDGSILFLISLTPLLAISQVVIYSLSGLMRFKMVALLGQIQLVVVTLAAACSWMLAPTMFRSHAFVILASAIVLSHAIIIVIGARCIIKDTRIPQRGWFLPQGFWKFTGYVQLNTFCTFAYTNIDQIQILSHLGIRELGIYYAILQCAMLINFLPQKLGQVLLSSFSALIAAGRMELLHSAYLRLCRYMLTIATPLAIFLIVFSYQITGLFGPWLAEKHHYLILLTAALFIGSIGSINAMLLMSDGRAGAFFANSLILIFVQLGVSWLTIGEVGTFGVIAGRAAGIMCGQIGLFALVKLHFGMGPPREYWLALGVVSSAMFFALSRGPLGWIDASWLLLGLSLLYLYLIRFQRSELHLLVANIRQRNVG